jgi:hypothetical protein
MLLAPLLAAAAVAAPHGPVDYQVVKATHASSIARADAGYRGRSTTTWSLSRASTFRMHWIARDLYSGSGRMHVRGSYAVDATTSWPGHCAFTAATGDAEHPLTAPAPFELSVAPNPRNPGMATVGFVAVRATLGNAYMGTECASRADEPAWEETETIQVAPSRLRGRTITLTFAGSRPVDGGSATWRTEIVLKRKR